MKNLEVKYIESNDYEYFIIPATTFDGLELYIKRKDLGVMTLIFGLSYDKVYKTREDLERLIYINIENNEEEFIWNYENDLEEYDRKVGE